MWGAPERLHKVSPFTVFQCPPTPSPYNKERVWNKTQPSGIPVYDSIHAGTENYRREQVLEVPRRPHAFWFYLSWLVALGSLWFTVTVQQLRCLWETVEQRPYMAHILLGTRKLRSLFRIIFFPHYVVCLKQIYCWKTPIFQFKSILKELLLRF